MPSAVGLSRRTSEDRVRNRVRAVDNDRDYLTAASNFYGQPIPDTFVVETIYKRPHAWASLHEYEGGPEIDRVPTAAGFHSMDSAEDVGVALSVTSRYELPEDNEEDETDQDPSLVDEIKQNQANAISFAAPENGTVGNAASADNGRYITIHGSRSRDFSKGGTSATSKITYKSVGSDLESVDTDDSDSCPAIWLTESQEEKRDHNWMIAQAIRARELNTVKIPKNVLKKYATSQIIRNEIIEWPEKPKRLGARFGQGIRNLLRGRRSRSYENSLCNDHADPEAKQKPLSRPADPSDDLSVGKTHHMPPEIEVYVAKADNTKTRKTEPAAKSRARQEQAKKRNTPECSIDTNSPSIIGQLKNNKQTSASMKKLHDHLKRQTNARGDDARKLSGQGQKTVNTTSVPRPKHHLEHELQLVPSASSKKPHAAVIESSETKDTVRQKIAKYESNLRRDNGKTQEHPRNEAEKQSDVSCQKNDDDKSCDSTSPEKGESNQGVHLEGCDTQSQTTPQEASASARSTFPDWITKGFSNLANIGNTMPLSGLLDWKGEEPIMSDLVADTKSQEDEADCVPLQADIHAFLPGAGLRKVPSMRLTRRPLTKEEVKARVMKERKRRKEQEGKYGNNREFPIEMADVDEADSDEDEEDDYFVPPEKKGQRDLANSSCFLEAKSLSLDGTVNIETKREAQEPPAVKKSSEILVPRKVKHAIDPPARSSSSPAKEGLTIEFPKDSCSKVGSEGGSISILGLEKSAKRTKRVKGALAAPHHQSRAPPTESNRPRRRVLFGKRIRR